MPDLSPTDLNALILDTIDSLVVVLDTDARIVGFNRACERVTGYTFDEVRGRTTFELFLSDVDHGWLRTKFAELVAGYVGEGVEADWVVKGGGRRRIAWTNALSRGADGRVNLVVATGVDVTERRVAERDLLDANAALRASEGRMRQMFESNAIGMAVCHVEGLIVEANEAYLRLTGYSREDLLARRINWPDLTPPEYAPADHAARDALLQRGVCEPYEKEYIRKDGRRVPVLIAGFAYDPVTGNCPTFVLDLSDRRRAEEAERTALRRLRMALETARMAVWEWDPQSDISVVAGDMTETYGVAAPPANELLTYVHPDDQRLVMETVHRALAEGGPCEIEFRAVRPDGQVRWVRDVCRRRIAESGRPTLAGVSVDVTDRKQAELALRDSEERFRQMIESSPDTMFYQDVDQRIVWVTRLAPPLTLADVIGQTDEIFLGRTEHLRLAAIKNRVMASGVGERVETVAHIEGRGVRHFDVALERWQDPHGGLRGIAGYARDITERKEVEAQTLALTETLERHVAERTVQLVEANAALQSEVIERQRAEAELRHANADLRRMADHNRLLAREVEHRVRNNLASLLGLVNVMGHRSPDVATFSRAMESRLTAMVHTHRLLAEASWRPIDLGTLVTSTLAAMRHISPHPNPAVANGPAVLLPARHALPLTMVLVEWFTNSGKYVLYSAPGGRVDVTWELFGGNGGETGDADAEGDRTSNENGNGEEPLPAGRDLTVCGPNCRRVRLRWTESGGPPIGKPGPPSIGTDLVRGFVSRELAGTCHLDYPREGARHVLEFCPHPSAEDDPSSPPAGHNPPA